MSEIRKDRPRADANRCFVCGPDNEHGLQLTFSLEDDCCVAEFTPADHMIGYDDQVHGGILFSFLDDAMANYLFLKGRRAHTAKCEIRYRAAVKPGTTLRAEARPVKEKGRLITLEAKAIDTSDGSVVVEALGSFMIST